MLSSQRYEVGGQFYRYDPTSGQTEFTADFIAEGVDQTRGWFYTLSAHCSAVSRKRFWGGEPGPDKTAAYQTLYEALRLTGPVSFSTLVKPAGSCARNLHER